MQQKPITISSNEFNEKIKNNLRDFYVYQFKKFRKDSTSDFRKKGTNESKPASTFTEEKQRLLSMLESQTQMQWKKEKGGICCCTVDTRSLDTNPFWVPYRFCASSPRYIGWLISMSLLLHPQIQLRDPLGLPTPLFPPLLQPLRPGLSNRLKAESREMFQSWLELRRDELYEDPQWGDFCTERYFAIYRQRINRKKMMLEDDPERFGATVNMLQYYYSKNFGEQDVQKDQFKNRLSGDITGILRSHRLSSRKEQWRLSDNRLVLPEKNTDLIGRLCQMLGFFSQTLPLGFVGTRLQTRIGGGTGMIRYKHSYIAKALNDYNIADLLRAMQTEGWVRLEYRNGTKLSYGTMVCFPLQIRESTHDGRQYLMYYHPGCRSLSALRLDFIDKIHFVSVIDRPYYAQDLEKAREALCYVWGCSMPDFFSGNLVQPLQYTHIRMQIRKDSPIVETRLRREVRHGQITQVDEEAGILTYEVKLTDPLEIIPWIRSFTSRILGLWVDGVACSVETTDPTEAMRDYLRQQQKERIAVPPHYDFQYDVEYEECKPDYYPHDLLFHPMFSLVFDVVAQVVFSMMKHPDRYYTHSQMTELIQTFCPSDMLLQDGILDSIYENITMLCSGKGRSYRLNYIPTEPFLNNCSNLWDLIPLSDLEASYLKSILSEEKAKLFLSRQEIECILSALDPQTEAIDFSPVHYYDQNRDITPLYSHSTLQEHFDRLLSALFRCKTLDTVYHAQRGTLSEALTPIRILYSKQADTFWFCCADEEGTISYRNLERFVSLSPTEKHRDCEALLLAAEEATRKELRTLVLEFEDEKNRAERLVTEFSPWKKLCVCNALPDKQSYTMTLTYDAQDAAEIAVRLLRYGEGITVRNDTGNVASWIHTRRSTLSPKG